MLSEQAQNKWMRRLRQAFHFMVLTIVGFGSICVARGDIDKTGRKSEIATNEQGYVTRMLWQPNVEHGIFELKQTDKLGTTTQWYQHFVDEDGKALIDIVRDPMGPGTGTMSESIRIIRYNVYRPDGNISEFYEFTGDGALRQRVKYKYDEKGNWLEGIIYNAQGKKVGKDMEPPEARLYNKKKDPK